MSEPSTAAGRRTFLRQATTPLAHAMAAAQAAASPRQRPGAPRVRLAIIGFGHQGGRLAAAAMSIAGAELVGVADLYDGRLERAREVAGPTIQAVKDYRQILERRDLEGVIVATPDHWHVPIVRDAIAAGKDVYCEAPVIHRADELASLLQAVPPDRIVQGGGGLISSPLFIAARDLVAQGRLGRIVEARAAWDSSTSLGAWQSPFPPDASPESIDYAAFVRAGAGASPTFDLHRFFRWRCYRQFGSGLAGARLAPLLTALHWLVGAGIPVKVTGAGALHRWKDGRDVPDTLSGVLEYEEQVSIHVSASQSGSAPGDVRICGTEASLVIRDRELLLEAPPQTEPFSDVGETWAKEQRDWFYMMHGMTPQGQVRGTPAAERTVERYELPVSAAASSPLAEFIDCVRTRRAPRETLKLAAEAAAAALQVDEAATRARAIARVSA
ncbi:MAG: Gfo/Idh/MocA family oxidoreductase [Vicinamibacterales bacterium]